MQTTVANRLSYYRNSIVDSGRMNPDIETLRKERLLLLHPLEEALSGDVMDKESVKAFLDRSAKDGKAEGERGEEKVPGILCPWVYLPRVVHGAAPEAAPFVLLCVPAVLTPEGLLLSAGELPWIPRTILQPLNCEGPTVGSVEDSDRFLASLEAGRGEDWDDLVEVCVRYIEAVTGSGTPPEIEGYVLDSRAAFFSGETIKATVHVTKLYDALLSGKGSQPLLERMIGGADSPLPLLLENTAKLSHPRGVLEPPART